MAPRTWILEARMLARAIPGISRFDTGGLLEMEGELSRGIRDAESKTVRFKFGTSELLPAAAVDLEGLVGDIRNLDRYARLLGRSLHIIVLGHADSSGLEAANSKLSLERAIEISKRVAAVGLKASTVQPEGKGAHAPLRPERSEEDRSYNRSASVRITIDDHAS